MKDPESFECFCCLNPGHTQCGGTPTQPTAPNDPNLKVSPTGHGMLHFIRGDSLLPYTVHFENATNATAPAQQVFISDPLTNILDWQTFELTEIAFGDHFIAVPPGTKHFERKQKFRFNNVDFEVQIEAGIRLATGEVYATFRSVIPATGLPPDVDTGFLPPENGTGRGQGHIGYVIRPQPNLTTGTEIRNVAWITFDVNPAIRTDQVDPHDPSKGINPDLQAWNTIDADPPQSSVTVLPTESSSRFDVTWSGNDLGAGVASYDIYVSTNGGPWTVWLASTPNPSALFTGKLNDSYAFYSIARDHTGNSETPPAQADTGTKVTRVAPGLPLQLTATYSQGLLTLKFPSVAGTRYHIEFSETLLAGSWTARDAEYVGTGGELSVSEAVQTEVNRFYRVVASP